MSKKKVRAGHRGFLTKIIGEANERLEDRYSTVGKTELLKWKASLGEQLQKFEPLDFQKSSCRHYKKRFLTPSD